MDKKEFLEKIGLKTQFTSANAAEMGRKGGRKKGFAKSFREAAEAELKKKKVTQKGEVVNGREAIMMSLAKEAMKGNVKAIEMMLKIVGENPVERLELSGGVTFTDLLMKTGTTEDGE